MDTSKSKKNEFRSSVGSSILKPRKPRQPLQSLGFDISSDENNPIIVSPKFKRRVSFAEKKHVKEFCHSTDQGTVWDNTYEEHDVSHKESSDTDETCVEQHNKESEPGQIVTSNIFDASSISNAVSNNIVYEDYNEDCAINIGKKHHSASCFNNVNFELNKTCIEDISMEFTTGISTPLTCLSLRAEDQEDMQKDNDTCLNNSPTNYYNVSMEITEAISVEAPPVETVSCNLKIDGQISTMIPNCENMEHDIVNNICNNTIFSTNPQFNIVSTNIVSQQKQNTEHADDSMILTTVIQSVDTCHTNNVAFNTSLEMTTAVPSKLYEGDLQHPRNKSIVERDNLRNVEIDETEFFNDAPMEIMRPVNVTFAPLCAYNKENLRVDKPGDDRTTFFHNLSMEMTAAMSSRNGNVINQIACKISEENAGKEESTKSIVKDTMDAELNIRDSIDEINECSFLTKSLPYLEDRFVELQSIKPPSFMCLDSREENSFCDTLCADESQTSIIADNDILINNKYDSFNRLTNRTTNSTIESECSSQWRKSIEKDCENFTIFREKELTNNQNNQTENCYENTTMNKTEDNQKASGYIIVDNSLINNKCNIPNQLTNRTESERPEESEKNVVKDDEDFTILRVKEESTDIENNWIEHYCEDISSNTKDNLKTNCQVIDENQMAAEKYTRERNNCAKLQNNIKKRWQQYLNLEERMEVGQYTDDVENTEVIIKDAEKYCREDLNDETKLCIMEQEKGCVEEKFKMEQSVRAIEDEFVMEQDCFLSLLQRLEIYSKSDNCIWNVYHKNIDRKIVTFGFMANSLFIVTYLSDTNCPKENLRITEVKIVSRIADDVSMEIKIVHKLILEKLSAEVLINLCMTHEDILPMLNVVSQDVILTMDFMFDLRCFNNLNLMEISTDEITFVTRSKHMDIILKVTIKVKRFDELTSNDINIRCLLGSIREREIRNLIKNVKKDHKFLTRYANDVKEYLDIIEETSK